MYHRNFKVRLTLPDNSASHFHTHKTFKLKVDVHAFILYLKLTNLLYDFDINGFTETLDGQSVFSAIHYLLIEVMKVLTKLLISVVGKQVKRAKVDLSR